MPPTNFLHSFASSQDFTSGLLTTFCMHLNLVSMSKLPPCHSTTSCDNLVSISNFPPVPLIKLPKLPCVHWASISILPPQPPHNFLRSFCFNICASSPVPHNNLLHSSCFNIPGAPEQLPAFIWFYIWSHRGLLKSPPQGPETSSPM